MAAVEESLKVPKITEKNIPPTLSQLEVYRRFIRYLLAGVVAIGVNPMHLTVTFVEPKESSEEEPEFSVSSVLGKRSVDVSFHGPTLSFRHKCVVLSSSPKLDVDALHQVLKQFDPRTDVDETDKTVPESGWVKVPAPAFAKNKRAVNYYLELLRARYPDGFMAREAITVLEEVVIPSGTEKAPQGLGRIVAELARSGYLILVSGKRHEKNYRVISADEEAKAVHSVHSALELPATHPARIVAENFAEALGANLRRQDELREKEAHLAELAAQTAELEAEISELRSRLIDPEQLAEILKRAGVSTS